MTRSGNAKQMQIALNKPGIWGQVSGPRHRPFLQLCLAKLFYMVSAEQLLSGQAGCPTASATVSLNKMWDLGADVIKKADHISEATTKKTS